MRLFDAESKSAVLSECGLYRYRLGRTWDADARPLVFVMLNPSTADATVDDPTIRRCVGFAKASDAGGIDVVNLFAFRATDPDDMAKADDPIGEENDLHLLRAAEGGFRTVVAWGASVPKRHGHRVNEVLRVLRMTGRTLYCLGTTKDGRPRHPLFVKADQPLVHFGASPVEAIR